ncbi:MAG: EamA/RhaT family transporter [Jatrophihabitans sp.]|nr:MAG: EamA/RhaT family transporter [Jatrophihabitans sp.]
MRDDGAGLGLAFISAAAFGTSGSLAASLLASGWSSAAAVLLRISIGAAVLTVPAVLQLRGQWSRFGRRLRSLSLYGLLAVGGGQLCYFNAVRHMSIAVALLVEYSGTLLVVAWVWLRSGERPTRLTLAGAVLAIAGLVPVLDLTGPQRVDAVGLAWAGAAAVGLAVYFVLSARAETGLPGTVLAWAGMGLGAVEVGAAALVGAVPFAVSGSPVRLAGHPVSWLVPILGLSLVACAFAYLLGIAAARRLGARLGSFVAMTEVLFATGFAWLLLGQRPTGLQVAGGLVVLAGIALVRAGEPAAPRTDLADARAASPAQVALAGVVGPDRAAAMDAAAPGV